MRCGLELGLVRSPGAAETTVVGRSAFTARIGRCEARICGAQPCSSAAHSSSPVSFLQGRHMPIRAVLLLLVSAAQVSADSTPLTLVNGGYDDDLFRFSFGDPGHCVGEDPKCGSVAPVKKGASQHFVLAKGANYLAIGGGIKTQKDGSVCHTFLGDDNTCQVYDGSADADCARLAGATCTRSGSTLTLNVTVDRKCDTLPYEDCTDASICCGAGNKCVQYDPTIKETKCWPSK